MREIRALTTEIVAKVKGAQGKEIEGDFKPLGSHLPEVRHHAFIGNIPRLQVRQPECRLTSGRRWPAANSSARKWRSCSPKDASARSKASAASSAALRRRR